MKIKALAISALIGASLISGQASAWSNHHHKKVERISTHTHHVYVKPADNWHKHPRNAYTNDTYHNHPNGLNYHVHTYGKGPKKSHTHHGYVYEICPYPGH